MTAIILEAALRGLALAAMVGLALRLLRVRNVPARKAAWTLVLLAAFAMPLLMRAIPSRMGWLLPIHFAPKMVRAAATPAVAAQVQPMVLQQAAARISAAPVSATTDRTPAATAPLSIDLAPSPTVADSAPAPSAQPVPIPRRAFHLPPAGTLLVGIYLALAAILLLRLVIGLFVALRLWMTADRVSPLIAPEPNVRSSSRIASPVTIGSGIVLPANYTQWDARKLRMVMAHERSHVRQLDFYLQVLAGLYTALFWFSPLGWWLRRTLSSLGEAIGDRAGISAAQSRSGYASLVLEFAALPHKLLPGVAMARSTNLSRRVDSMLNENLFRSLFSEGRRRAMASLLVIPAALFAVTALVRVPTAAAQAVPQNTQPSQAQTPAEAPTTGQSNPPETQITNDAAPDAVPAPALAPDQAVPAPPPMPAAPQGQGTTVIPSGDAQTPPSPTALSAPPAVVAPQAEAPLAQDLGSAPNLWVKIPQVKIPNIDVFANPNVNTLAFKNLLDSQTLFGSGDNVYFLGNGGVHGDAYYFSSNGDSWALVDGTGKHLTLGDGATKDQLDLAQRMARGPFLWFTHDGKSYIVDDPAIVAQIRSLYAPMKDLSRQEEDLGVQERVVGRLDEELARSMRDDATVRLPDLSKEMADAQAALDNLKSEQGQMLSEEKLAETQAKLAEMEARLGSLEARAAAQNNSAERMRALGEQERQLGDQQRQLGDQQKKLAQQAEQQVKNLIQECLSNGKATQVK